MTGLYSTITEYAMRNWIAHYRLAEMGYTLYDRFLLAFIGEETNIQKWLSLVESFSRPPQQKTNRVINLFNEQLREHLDMSFFKNLEILYNLATHPLFSSGLDRLLVYAAERGGEVLVESICTNIGFIDRKAVI